MGFEGPVFVWIFFYTVRTWGRRVGTRGMFWSTLSSIQRLARYGPTLVTRYLIITA